MNSIYTPIELTDKNNASYILKNPCNYQINEIKGYDTNRRMNTNPDSYWDEYTEILFVSLIL